MFGGLRRLLGAEEVIEHATTIEVTGVPADVMSRDIAKIWETSRINNYMFTKLTRNGFIFPKFFAIDILYMLKTMVAHRSAKTNVRALKSIIDKLETQTWLADIGDDSELKKSILDFSKLSALNVTMKPKQMEFLEMYNTLVPKYDLQGYLLAADPGTGKTLASLGLSLCLGADKVIIVAPKNAVYEVWEDTLKIRFDVPQKYWIAANGKPLDPEAKYFIVHYEALKDFVPLISTLGAKNPLIILDECHNLNEISSARTNYFVDMCQRLKAQHVLWMSGTPIKAIGNEVIPLLRTIDRYFNPYVEERFKKIFGKSASRAVDILRNRLGLVTFKVDIKEVQQGEPRYTTVKVKIPNGEQYTLSAVREEIRKFIDERTAYYKKEKPRFEALYEKCLNIHQSHIRSRSEQAAFDLYRDHVKTIQRGYDPELMREEAMYCNNYETRVIMPSLPQEIRNEFKDVRAVIKYVSLKIQGEALGRVLGRKRAQCHVDMVEHANLPEIIDSAVKKTLIFTSYVDVLKKAQKCLSDEGYRPLVVYQDTNNDLSAIVKQLTDDIDANPGIATYKSLSTAVPMIMASTAIMVDSPFREYILKQAVARLHRLGQDTQVDIYMLQLDTGAEVNISTRNTDILQWSREQVAALMGTDPSKLPEITMENLDPERFKKHHTPDNNPLESDWFDFSWLKGLFFGFEAVEIPTLENEKPTVNRVIPASAQW